MPVVQHPVGLLNNGDMLQSVRQDHCPILGFVSKVGSAHRTRFETKPRSFAPETIRSQ